MDKNVPDVNTSHFNDELFGDEWLLQQIKWWRFASLSLAGLLIITWLFFFYQTSPSIEKEIEDNQITVDNKKLDTSKIKENEKANSIKNIYNPQKRTSALKQKEKTTEPVTTTTHSNVQAIAIDELPVELKNKIPDLVFDAYVVAEKEADSFIILNGTFYKVNQEIEPKLILRKINQENIVVEYYSYQIKIPFN